jgi:hypothetical protein
MSTWLTRQNILRSFIAGVIAVFFLSLFYVNVSHFGCFLAAYDFKLSTCNTSLRCR